MPVQPCVNKIPCADCYDPPLSNLSAEAPDTGVFAGVSYGTPYEPPIGTWYNAKGCLSVVTSDVSQEAADILALRQSIHCIDDTDPPPTGDGGPGGGGGGGDGPCEGNWCNVTTTYHSVEQHCTVNCPDGIPFTYTLPAGAVDSPFSQADADTRAAALCAQQAALKAICFATATFAPLCKGSGSFLHQFVVSGGSGTLTFSAAGLPPGVTITAAGLLSGTPTAGGVYDITVTVTDSSTPAVSASRNYTLYVTEILTGSPLTQGTVGTAYSATISAQGAPPSYYWSVVSGALPPGLTLDPVTGIISGVPTTGGTYTFEVALVIP